MIKVHLEDVNSKAEAEHQINQMNKKGGKGKKGK